MPIWLQEALRTAEGSFSRSTAMQPLLWILALLGSLLLALVLAGAPSWVVVVLVSILGGVIVTAVVVFCCLLNRHPDMLRSEKYLIHKLEVERLGDSVTGLRSVGPLDEEPPKALGGGA